MRETRPVKIANNAPPMRAAANWVTMEPVLNPPVLHRGEQGNGLQKLRSDTVADCSGDDVVELLSKAAQYVGARRTGDRPECS